MLFGAHLSVAGGLHRALESARDYGFEAVALFVRSPRQWKARPLSDAQVDQFKGARKTAGTKCVVAHASYLINLAGEDAVRSKGRAALIDDLQRCNRLGIESLVLHPGSHTDAAVGIDRIVGALDEIMANVPAGDTRLLLETMAGQGKSIGGKFEQLGEMLQRVRDPERLGICLDTAHVFAAGYDIRTPESWESMIDAFDSVIGLDRLRAVHCNDSAKPLGSQVDRHAAIGLGEIGEAGFANLVNDPRLEDLPCILETPKGKRDSDGEDWDLVNVETLRRLQR